MAIKSLAIKYRPKTFDDVIEQDYIKVILKQQLDTGSFKNSYLFTGGAGTGKTTCARIFANEINNGHGNPIEMDAASNSGVDNVRDIIAQAKTKSINSEYKVFIIDECHSISNTGWQAFLKLIEEPPAKSIFIFCTTDPQKIPKTILSRVQRYDFHRISQKGISNRLMHILSKEDMIGKSAIDTNEAVEYIAKLADGGMRDAITMLDKCLSFGELTLKNVIDVIGAVDYDVMIRLTDFISSKNVKGVIDIIEDVHNSGKNVKQFARMYDYFLFDVLKYVSGCDFEQLQIPKLDIYVEWLDRVKADKNSDDLLRILDVMIKLNADIKYSAYPKADMESALLICMMEDLR